MVPREITFALLIECERLLTDLVLHNAMRTSRQKTLREKIEQALSHVSYAITLRERYREGLPLDYFSSVITMRRLIFEIGVWIESDPSLGGTRRAICQSCSLDPTP
jgi:hypothetical protein